MAWRSNAKKKERRLQKEVRTSISESSIRSSSSSKRSGRAVPADVPFCLRAKDVLSALSASLKQTTELVPLRASEKNWASAVPCTTKREEKKAEERQKKARCRKRRGSLSLSLPR